MDPTFLDVILSHNYNMGSLALLAVMLLALLGFLERSSTGHDVLFEHCRHIPSPLVILPSQSCNLYV
jgi:hypothetical protein